MPSSLLDIIVNGEEPTRLVFELVEPIVWGPEIPIDSRPFLTPVLHAAFVHYYESVVELVEVEHGRARKPWPDVLRFGWAIRNAFAHGGGLYFDKPSIPAVTWRGWTYSHVDNDRSVLYTDLMPADVIVLMEEMDDAIPR